MLQAGSCVEHGSWTADGGRRNCGAGAPAGAIHLVAGRAFNQGDRLRRFETNSPSSHGCASRSTGDPAQRRLRNAQSRHDLQLAPSLPKVVKRDLTGSRGDEIASRILRRQQGKLATRATLNAVDTPLKAKSGEGLDLDRTALRSCSTGFLCNVGHYPECVRSH